jgi:peptidoglycan-associated lipoprotein
MEVETMRHALILGLMVAGAGLAGCSTSALFKDKTVVIATPARCAPIQFEIYFADSEAGLTEPARQTIGLNAARLQTCTIKSVRVVGLADARGGAAANQTLSERRAEAVAQALTGAGWPTPVFDVSAEGDSGAVTDQGVREPLRRRTEVFVEAVPKT